MVEIALISYTSLFLFLKLLKLFPLMSRLLDEFPREEAIFTQSNETDEWAIGECAVACFLPRI